MSAYVSYVRFNVRNRQFVPRKEKLCHIVRRIHAQNLDAQR